MKYLKNYDLSKNDKLLMDKKARSQKRKINSYCNRYNKDLYQIGDYGNNGFDSELKDTLIGAGSKSLGWQLPYIDWYAIEDFVRGYKTHKKTVASYALRHFLPKDIYDYATIEIIKEHPSNNYKIEGDASSRFKASTLYKDIDEYVIKSNIEVIKPLPGPMCDTLMGFSWKFYEIDAKAAELFKVNYGFDYNMIIKNAIRSFLCEENYKNAQELLDLIEEQDKRRKY